MLHYAQQLTVIAMGVFLSSVVFLSYLTSSYHAIVYAAVISCVGCATCYGTYGDDNMRGNSGHNTIGSLDGNDQVNGGPGNDFLHGGYGNDDLSAGPGDDMLYGSVGADSLKCGAGNDQINFFNPSEGDTKSNDCERLWSANATFGGFPENVTLRGFHENVTLSGFHDNVTLSGGPSNDTSNVNNLSSQ